MVSRGKVILAVAVLLVLLPVLGAVEAGAQSVSLQQFIKYSYVEDGKVVKPKFRTAPYLPSEDDIWARAGYWFYWPRYHYRDYHWAHNPMSWRWGRYDVPNHYWWVPDPRGSYDPVVFKEGTTLIATAPLTPIADMTTPRMASRSMTMSMRGASFGGGSRGMSMGGNSSGGGGGSKGGKR